MKARVNRVACCGLPWQSGRSSEERERTKGSALLIAGETGEGEKSGVSTRCGRGRNPLRLDLSLCAEQCGQAGESGILGDRIVVEVYFGGTPAHPLR